MPVNTNAKAGASTSDMKSHLYVISARWWNEALIREFGAESSRHTLTDEQVILAIMRFGRASITLPSPVLRKIEFENDYD